MPIYEFRCMQCDTEFEDLCLSSSDLDSVSCPQCKGSETERLMSVFAMASRSSELGAQSSTGKSSCATCSATSCRTCPS
jgi:putative FmdB family regulatory protein